MARFSFSGSYPPSKADWDKLIRAAGHGIETADFDTKWITTPGSKVIRHNLGVLPSEIWVYSSAFSNGEPHAQDTFISCDRTNITITGPSPFCRVRMNVGS